MDNTLTRALSVRQNLANAAVARDYGDVRRELHELSEALTLSQTRGDSYRFSALVDTFVPTEDYTQGDYPRIDQLYTGSHLTGIQLGSLLAQPIVEFYTAFEMGVLPQVVVRQRKKSEGASTTGNIVEEMSAFVNGYNSDNHAQIIECTNGKNTYGETYLVFGLDRQLEAIAPYPNIASPGFNIFNDRLHNFRTAVTRIVQSPKTGEKKRVIVRRHWDAERVVYEVVPDEQGVNLGEFVEQASVEVPHSLGQCPVVIVTNNRKPGSVFGHSQFSNVIPFMNVYHNVLIRGFEAQQYMGKPILMISGIPGQVATWLKKTFNIDVGKTTQDAQKTQMMEFYKQHKFFAFADQVKAEFIESKYPIGATAEIAKMAFNCIVMVSGVPEFMFGVAIESSNASVREQYVPLKARLKRKQREWEPTLRQVAKWALLGYSTATTDPTTGQALPIYGFITDPARLDEFTIDLIWPPMLNSDEDMRLQALTLLANTGAISYRGLHENLPEYVPDSDRELARVEEEYVNDALRPKTQTQPVDDGGSDRTSERRRTQRRNDDPGNAGDNSGRTGRGTK